MSSRWFAIPEGSNLLRDLLVAVVAVSTVTGLRLLLIPVLYDRAAFLLFGLARDDQFLEGRKASWTDHDHLSQPGWGVAVRAAVPRVQHPRPAT